MKQEIEMIIRGLETDGKMNGHELYRIAMSSFCARILDMETQWDSDDERPQPWEFLWITDSLIEQYEAYIEAVNKRRHAEGRPLQPLHNREQFEEWWRSLTKGERNEWEEKFAIGYKEVCARNAKRIHEEIDRLFSEGLPKPGIMKKPFK